MNNTRSVSTNREDAPDPINEEKALRRAAKRARERAAKSGGTVAVYQDGQIIEEHQKDESAPLP